MPTAHCSPLDIGSLQNMLHLFLFLNQHGCISLMCMIIPSYCACGLCEIYQKCVCPCMSVCVMASPQLHKNTYTCSTTRVLSHRCAFFPTGIPLFSLFLNPYPWGIVVATKRDLVQCFVVVFCVCCRVSRCICRCPLFVFLVSVFFGSHFGVCESFSHARRPFVWMRAECGRHARWVHPLGTARYGLHSFTKSYPREETCTTLTRHTQGGT